MSFVVLNRSASLHLKNVLLLAVLVGVLNLVSSYWDSNNAMKTRNMAAGSEREETIASVVQKLSEQRYVEHVMSTEGQWCSNRTAALPSGWDEAGRGLHATTRSELAKAVTSQPNSVFTHQVLPLDPVRSAQRWFQGHGMNGQGPSRWEPETFENFFAHLTTCRYYVGFGEWIGPTVLFAAQMVDEAFVIEPDPVAFAQLQTNLGLNQNTPWGRRIHLNPHAVGVGSSLELAPVPVAMVSAAPGNSMSGIGVKGSTGWQVDSYTLPSLLARWGLAPTKELFIKVDVETFECKLIPSWIPWIRSITTRPTFHISFHSQLQRCTDAEFDLVYEFAGLFDSFSSAAIQNCVDHAQKRWTCGTGDFLFHNNL